MPAFQSMLFYSGGTFEFQCLLVIRKIWYIFGFHSIYSFTINSHSQDILNILKVFVVAKLSMKKIISRAGHVSLLVEPGTHNPGLDP